MQTKIIKKCFNPEYDEEFIFDVAAASFSAHKLQIMVLDFDQFSQDECIGMAELSLDEVEFVQNSASVAKGLSAPEKDQNQVS